MKRLVYAPKAYIFIRSSNLGGKIYDVSNDVARGSVTQVCGDVSKAEFELRNRYQKWIRDVSAGSGTTGPSNRQIFLPMDMLTIYLQRISGKPIQVFTGYLDEAPYYQAYPGNAIFKASCTLKKLAFTWFDPGLQTFTQWVNSTNNWTFDPSSGEGFNAQAKQQAVEIQGDASLSVAPAQAATAVNDTGFAALLGRFMLDIAGWSADDILIQPLPPDIPEKAAKLYNKITQETSDDLKALEDYFRQAMGVQGYVPPGATTPTTVAGAPAQTHQTQTVITTMQKICDDNNIPLVMAVWVALWRTNLDSTYHVAQTTQNSASGFWGYGLFGAKPRGGGPDGPTGPVSGTGVTTSGNTNTFEGHTAEELLSPAIATQAFCDHMNRVLQGSKTVPSYIAAARDNDADAMKKWIQFAWDADFNKVSTGSFPNTFEQAKKYASMAPVVVPPNNSPSVGQDPASAAWTDSNIQAILNVNPQDKDVYSTWYKKANPWLASIYAAGKNIGTSMMLAIPADAATASGEIIMTGTPGDLRKFFASLRGSDPYSKSIDSVVLMIAGESQTQNLVKGTLSNARQNVAKAQQIVITQTKKPPAAGASSSSSSGAGATPDPTPDATAIGGATFSQLGTFSADAAFAANFAFPTNQQESLMLTGDRALMNDVSCLDGVKQFCASSMRQFRSLPDGRFLAFYPDYFGATRSPYWAINNIEITEFGIQVNDEALATHVYVVGDTFDGDGTIDMYDDAGTRGVATITQAFMLDSFISKNQPDESGLGRLVDAYNFLKHYGARPHKTEQPLIRNTLFEFLMAWQQFMYLWAQQFATNCSFTFQPEVMAGGLIEFPDHGVQMYVEQVTHNFDYTGGFDTQAVMTAPSIPKRLASKTPRLQKPGFALGGNVNTVGVE